MAGGSSGKKAANPDEFHPTPEGTVRAVIPVLREIGWPDDAWECACGEGHISKQLLAAGFAVTSSNLIDRGYGDVGVDFLATERARAKSVITNPPFSLADAFVAHAQTMLGIEYIALLLPNGIYHAKTRVPMFYAHRPSLILPCTWRIDVERKGAPTMNVSWYVWHPTVPPIAGYYPLVSDEKHPGRYDAA